MLYYKLGQKEMKPYIQEGSRRWAEFGASRPVLRKLVIFAMVFVTIVILLGGIAPNTSLGYDPKNYINAAKNAVSGTGV